MRTFLRDLGTPVVAFVVVALSSGGALGQEAVGTVTITQGGTGQGTVTSSPEGITCTLGFGDPAGTMASTSLR
jgi:hypothetical protein